MAQDLKNISAAPILDENESARKLSAQKALARRQAQMSSISSDLGKAPVFEDVGMDKGDIGMEMPAKKGEEGEEEERGKREGEEGGEEQEGEEQGQEQTQFAQQQTATMTMASQQQQQQNMQIRRAVQMRQNQIEQSNTKIKTYTKKIASLQARERDGKKLTLFLKLLSLCTIVGAALAFVIKHIVNFFTDVNKIERQIKSIQKKIKSEENNKKQLEKALQNEYQTLNQNQ